jgi:predicted Zn-dependent peptidase
MIDIATLENGVKVVVEEIPSARSVSMGLFVLNGSRNERSAESGISHFIEHMLFKGTARRGAREIAEEMDRVGGQLNAFTGKDYTCYYARVLDTHIRVAVDVLSDMFFNSLFDDGEIAKERNVVIEEINMEEDSPEDTAHDLLLSHAWKRNPLAKPILGSRKTLKAFNHDVVSGYYAANYTPERTVIAVAGNWGKAEALKVLTEIFGSFGGGAKPRAVPAPVFRPGVARREKETEQLHVCIGFEGINADDKDAYALAAVNTILGGGMSSRMFQNIREKRGLVYSIYSYATSYSNAGIVTIYAGLSPACAEEAIPLILNEARSLAGDGVSEELLHKTKEQLKSNYILSLESTSARMSAIGRAALLLGRVHTPDEILEKIDGVTADRVTLLARRLLNVEKAALAAVGRTGGIDLEGLLRESAG